MKRITWFVVGAASGIAATRAAKRKVQATVERISPDHVARHAVQTAKDTARDVVEALKDGRAVMVAKEAEMRARRDGHAVTIPDAIETTEVSHLDDWRHRRSR